jgi:hypothetical protein
LDETRLGERARERARGELKKAAAQKLEKGLGGRRVARAFSLIAAE